MSAQQRTTGIVLAVALGLLGLGLGELLATDPPAPSAAVPEKAAPRAATTTAPRNDEEATLAFLKQNEPDVYHDTLLLRDRDPQKYAELLKEFVPEVRSLTDLQKRNPAMFALVIEDRRLAYRALQISKDLRDSGLTPENRAARTADLTTVVTSQFAVRQKRRQMELDDQARKLAELQRKLDDMKHDLDDREKNRDSLITQRVADLLKKNPRVEW
jgi:hypothetical protein